MWVEFRGSIKKDPTNSFSQTDNLLEIDRSSKPENCEGYCGSQAEGPEQKWESKANLLIDKYVIYIEFQDYKH